MKGRKDVGICGHSSGEQWEMVIAGSEKQARPKRYLMGGINRTWFNEWVEDDLWMTSRFMVMIYIWHIDLWLYGRMMVSFTEARTLKA